MRFLLFVHIPTANFALSINFFIYILVILRVLVVHALISFIILPFVHEFIYLWYWLD
jgi:hypothetical protein